jgi:hypothetical protein
MHRHGSSGRQHGGTIGHVKGVRIELGAFGNDKSSFHDIPLSLFGRSEERILLNGYLSEPRIEC